MLFGRGGLGHPTLLLLFWVWRGHFQIPRFVKKMTPQKSTQHPPNGGGLVLGVTRVLERAVHVGSGEEPRVEQRGGRPGLRVQIVRALNAPQSY